MKILNINKLQNEQKNITQKHLQEFAQESSITFTGLIKQTYDDRKGLKQIIMQFEPIVKQIYYQYQSKIYAEVLGIQMQQIKDSLDDPQVNAREQVITLMIYIEEVLQEIEKHYQIPYNKQYFEDAFYEITIPEIVQEDAGAINNDGWCQKCTIS
ncbi:unnamed protein product (macronuclear) [Paramecium tetraurelia]|uniref:Uncharacterized protein n=1 Tax=Paramecium tetraurelia TaxID=5888 RepID=A0DQF9_PARTE|nr:uncharacterized protein GSPATT00002676001 [Paramecium tetraurelia]CAK85276.1 unnamed protein product [Paramecium tetraurelia]|eukprot:XP_001452673.1 hypothetical protein (macronuclear) [Paramecium tetraurelia strain d4-2]